MTGLNDLVALLVVFGPCKCKELSFSEGTTDEAIKSFQWVCGNCTSELYK